MINEAFVEQYVKNNLAAIKEMLPSKNIFPVNDRRVKITIRNKQQKKNNVLPTTDINEYAVLFIIVEGIVDYLYNVGLLKIEDNKIKAFYKNKAEFKFQKMLIDDLKYILKITKPVSEEEFLNKLVLEKIQKTKLAIKDAKEWDEVAEFFIAIELYYLYLKNWKNKTIKKHHNRVVKIYELMKKDLKISPLNRVFLNSMIIAEKLYKVLSS